MLKKIIYPLVILSAVELTGCASNASTDRMVYSEKMAGKPKNTALVASVGVSPVSGGHETNPLFRSQINNENFKQALEQSLVHANLAHKLNPQKYLLKAELTKVQQPFLGLDLKVTCQVHYTLQDVKLNKSIYDKEITTSYTATFNDSALAITRLKIANEGAARENIKQLINDLYRL